MNWCTKVRSRNKIWLPTLLLLGLLPTLGFNSGDYDRHPGLAAAMLALMALFFCTMPIMTIKGVGSYGVYAHVQLPVVLIICSLAFLWLRRNRVAMDRIILITVGAYMVGTLLTNLASTMVLLKKSEEVEQTLPPVSGTRGTPAAYAPAVPQIPER